MHHGSFASPDAIAQLVYACVLVAFVQFLYSLAALSYNPGPFSVNSVKPSVRIQAAWPRAHQCTQLARSSVAAYLVCIGAMLGRVTPDMSRLASLQLPPTSRMAQRTPCGATDPSLMFTCGCGTSRGRLWSMYQSCLIKPVLVKPVPSVNRPKTPCTDFSHRNRAGESGPSKCQAFVIRSPRHGPPS